MAKNLRGQGSRLSAGQAEGCPHAPEEAAPPPTVGFRVIIDGLVPIPEVTLSLVVGKEIQQAKKIPMNASGGGDYRREESPALFDEVMMMMFARLCRRRLLRSKRIW